jgi:hypothetical protein
MKKTYFAHWLDDHANYPYPTEGEKQQFMGRTLLTLNQVSQICEL